MATRAKVSPILTELLKEMKLEDRLRSLECNISQGAGCNTRLLEEMKLESLSDMDAAVVRMEKVLDTKADQKVVDEMEQTVKVSNRITAELAKLIPVQDNLQYNIALNMDLLKQTNDNLQSLQEVVTRKAEKSTVEELASSVSSRQGNSRNSHALAELGPGACEHASSADLEAAVHHLQLEFKRMAMGISEIRPALESKADRQELQEVAMMKTDRKEFQEIVASLRAFQKLSVEQADIADLKLHKMEALINQRGHHGVGDLTEDVAKLKDQLLQKADSHTLEKMVVKLKDQLLQKADSHTLEELMKTMSVHLRQNAETQSSVECALEKLRQEHLDKANSEDVAKKLDEVALGVESITWNPGMKRGRLGSNEAPTSGSTSPACSTPSRSTTSSISTSASLTPSVSRFFPQIDNVPLPSAFPHMSDRDAPILVPNPVSARPVRRMMSTAMKDLCKNPSPTMAEPTFHAGSVMGA